MQSLPIDEILSGVTGRLRRAQSLVIEAPPGAGKTTRVPPAILDAGVAGEGQVLVLEPRRIAARMAARRVAEECGERVGETIGYQVRFEDVSSARTRLRFLTEGVLTRRLLADPRLAGVGCVVLDEFHERHLQADVALALLRRLQRTTRPDLKVVAMSATLDAAPVASYLGCEVLRSEGRRFDVNVEHAARHDERALEAQVEAAVRRLVSEGLDGDVLVFLPGAASIRRAQGACERVAAEAGLRVLPLHGELPSAQQDEAVRPSDVRKLILSTNVAETSVTIEGVAAVVDSGLARVAGHSPWSGLPVLKVSRVSRASAVQRAGRAGRTRAGRCLRLYTAQDFNARPEYETPEVRRLDLAETVLELRASGVEDVAGFDWFEPPSSESLAAAEVLLRRLGATGERGRVTDAGRSMLRMPLHPRLARIVVEAERRGVADDACTIAALIAERGIRAGRVRLGAGREGKPAGRETPRRGAEKRGSSDLIELLELFSEAESAGFDAERVRRLDLEPNAVRAVSRAGRQLRRTLSRGVAKSENRDAQSATDSARVSPARRGADEGRARGNAGRGGARLSEEDERELLISVLAGYPDRVARRRASKDARDSSRELLLSGGGAAELAPESVVRGAEFMVAVDAEERGDTASAFARAPKSGAAAAKSVVRLASAIEPDWLLDLFADSLAERVEARWNAQGERVEVVRRLVYDQLVIDEWRADKAEGEEVTRALASAALDAGARAFADSEQLESFLARVEFVAGAFPEEPFPALSDADADAALEEMCEGRRSFAELREAARAGELLERLRGRLTREQSRLVARAAPERVTLARGRQARVKYERGRAPYVASRLQDFFGMSDGPRVACGRVALVLQLLAPNSRPVQVTTDLAGFWSRHYPSVRRELGRRYPRHAWPEDPLNV
ncbi:MAG TPA: ATP-dependent helicase C-terminal domain-containing protein [Pyrinomonadaceae bacterium]|nr:ATP-dependent helicase C-terminal domain-containing protein [Pyrinomonadaceae bacterium]